MISNLNPTMTLGAISDQPPCEKGWKKLLAALGYASGNFDRQRVVSLGDVATANDAAGAMRCIRALDWGKIEVRRAVIAGAVLPAIKRASKYTTDKRVHDAIAQLEKWCAGDDDEVDLNVAAYAADAAAADAAYAVERKQQRLDIIAAFPPVALAVQP